MKAALCGLFLNGAFAVPAALANPPIPDVYATSISNLITQIGDGQPQAPKSTVGPPHPPPSLPPPSTVKTSTISSSHYPPVAPPHPSQADLRRPIVLLTKADVCSEDDCRDNTCCCNDELLDHVIGNDLDLFKVNILSPRYPTSVSTSLAPPPKPTGKCPLDLAGDYQAPYSILVNGQTCYNITVGPSISTNVKFGIPAGYAGKTCSTVFALPDHGTMETSEYAEGGSGAIALTGGAGISSTFMPSPNSKTVVESCACKAGETVAYTLASTGTYNLNLFEDYNPCPIPYKKADGLPSQALRHYSPHSFTQQSLPNFAMIAKSIITVLTLAAAATATLDPATSNTKGKYPSSPGCSATKVSKDIQAAECSHNTRVSGTQTFAIFTVDHSHDSSHGAPYGTCEAYTCAPGTAMKSDSDTWTFFWSNAGAQSGEGAGCIKSPDDGTCGCEDSDGAFIAGSSSCS
ncbi:MAG: hypothetical protein Q9159_006456 [Coniocarpon cinnabarinum]